MSPHSPAIRPAIALQKVMSQKLVVHLLHFEARMVDVSLLLICLAQEKRLPDCTVRSPIAFIAGKDGLRDGLCILALCLYA